VRSPSEYAEDHLPGAVSMPVLSDAERAEVGTIYTQESPFRARKIGAALVARNAARHIEERLMGMEGGWRPLVYCWRGGQRSGSFASILSQIGWRVEVLEGGYRTWRRLVVGTALRCRSRAPADPARRLYRHREDGASGGGRGPWRAGDRPRRAGAAQGLDPR
jgi:tRNA 2-selenouridine synthase